MSGLNPLSSWLADEPLLQPGFVRGVLGVTHAKAQFRRFETDFQHSAFDYGSISDRGSERSREVRAEEREAELDDARFEAIWGPVDDLDDSEESR